MIKFCKIVIWGVALLCLCGCAIDVGKIRAEAIVNQTAPALEIPSYAEIAPIEIIYDNNPDISTVLEDYLEENSATLVIAANYEKIKTNRFIKIEVLAYTIQVLKNDWLEHVMIVAVTPSPIYDEAGNVYACSPRYFRVSSETSAEFEHDHDSLITKLLANEEFYNTLKSIVQ